MQKKILETFFLAEEKHAMARKSLRCRKTFQDLLSHDGLYRRSVLLKRAEVSEWGPRE
jgi:hypothetical protein